jgi:hypothetical protein
MKKITSAIVCIFLIVMIIEFKGQLAQDSTVSKIDKIVNPQVKTQNINDRIVTLQTSKSTKSNLVVPEFKLVKMKISTCNSYINQKKVGFENYMNFLNESCNYKESLTFPKDVGFINWLTFYSKANKQFQLFSLEQKQKLYNLIEIQLKNPSTGTQIAILNSLAIELLKDLDDSRYLELQRLNQEIESDLEYIQSDKPKKDSIKEEQDFVLFFKNQFNQVMHKP